MFYCTFTTGENKTKPTHVMCDADGCVYICFLHARRLFGKYFDKCMETYEYNGRRKSISTK